MKSRLLLHLSYFLHFRGLTLKSAINLYLSSLIDILLYVVSGHKYNPKTLFSGLYLVKPHNFYIFARGGTDDLYHCLFRRESDVEDLIYKTLEKGDVFVDVGANVGYYTLLASSLLGPRGVVISVEPVPETFKVLLRNIKLNGVNNVVAVPKAAWNNFAKLKICIPRKWYGLASVFRGKSLQRDEVTIVDAIPLDSVLGMYSEIKLVKIDVEGAEYQVLKGTRKALKKTRYVIFEFSREKDGIIHLLREEGFKIRKLKFATYVLAYKPYSLKLL